MHIHICKGEAVAKFWVEPEVLTRYVISGGGTGLHWDELDEDISVEYLLMEIGGRTHEARVAT